MNTYLNRARRAGAETPISFLLKVTGRSTFSHWFILFIFSSNRTFGLGKALVRGKKSASKLFEASWVCIESREWVDAGYATSFFGFGLRPPLLPMMSPLFSLLPTEQYERETMCNCSNTHRTLIIRTPHLWMRPRAIIRRLLKEVALTPKLKITKSQELTIRSQTLPKIHPAYITLVCERLSLLVSSYTRILVPLPWYKNIFCQ